MFAELFLDDVGIHITRGHAVWHRRHIAIGRTAPTPQLLHEFSLRRCARHARVRCADGVNESIYILWVYVVSRDRLGKLSPACMCLLHVICLHESFLSRLPVHWQAFANVGFDVAVLDAEPCEVRRQYAEECLQ